MIKAMDNWLNRITMYRLVLYFLIFLLGTAVLLSFLGLLAFDPFALLFTTGFLLLACSLTNWAFAKVWRVASNAESTLISALILALIIPPLGSPQDLWFLAWASILAMASKYILAINKKHIFNPIAFSVALTYFTINQSASWWVGAAPMLPFVLLGGLLVVRKIGRFDLVYSFLLATLATTIAFSILNGADLAATIAQIGLSTPLFFFASIILTEPLTTPPSQRSRIIYGALVGLLISPQVHFGAFYITPELAILMGNIYSFIVSPRTTLTLRLLRKAQLAPGIFDFTFAADRKFAFSPGQYMEWTVGHSHSDRRGNRRYFTLASAPTEDTLRLGVKFNDKSSSFKQAMLSLDTEHEIIASQLAGEFVLPSNSEQKCVFIAGGIGITPFRSMIKYLLDLKQPRPIVLFYVNRTADEIVYKDVFDRAQRELGIKTVYTVTQAQTLPSSWRGETGYISVQLIRKHVPDYIKCIFYISGPKGMIDSFKKLLRQLHIPESQIKTDFFAGLA